MITKFIKWAKGLWSKSDISDETRSSHQTELFIERLKKNAFYERTEPSNYVDEMASIQSTIKEPVLEFSTTTQKITDEFDQIPWARLTDDAKLTCISIARLDLAKQSHIITKLNEAL
jgi:hypothetical protein